MSRESTVQQQIRLDAAYNNIEMWRNNNGACVDATGRHIRYGLCNESKQSSEKIKSSDLIGVTPVFITPDMVGKVIGVFTAIECKPSDWNFDNNDKRAVAQSAFHDIVKKAGGFAGFARNIMEFKKIVRR